jgi:hypothetical protein
MESIHAAALRWRASVPVGLEPLKDTARFCVQSWVDTLSLPLSVQILDCSEASELRAALLHFTHETPLARILRLAYRKLFICLPKRGEVEQKVPIFEPLTMLFWNLWSAIAEHTKEIGSGSSSVGSRGIRDLRYPPRYSEMLAFID